MIATSYVSLAISAVAIAQVSAKALNVRQSATLPPFNIPASCTSICADPLTLINKCISTPDATCCSSTGLTQVKACGDCLPASDATDVTTLQSILSGLPAVCEQQAQITLPLLTITPTGTGGGSAASTASGASVTPKPSAQTTSKASSMSAVASPVSSSSSASSAAATPSTGAASGRQVVSGAVALVASVMGAFAAIF